MSTLSLTTGSGHLVHLRRNARARRLTLRVGAHDGRIWLTMPARAPLSAAQDFLQQQGEWLARAVARLPVRVPVRPGHNLPLRGEELVLRASTGRSARLAPGALLLPPERPGAAAARFLIAQARRDLAEACARHAAALGRAHGRISLRDPGGRWGSCTMRGDLMFSWRLVMAPPHVLDYVAAHEVAHLAQMNHSPAFWAEVARLRPDWRDSREWLRGNGAALHGFDFD